MNPLQILLLAVFQEACGDMHDKVVARTPIDTGRAKSSWNFNPDVADETVTPLLRDKTGPGGIIERKAKGAEELSTQQAHAAAAGRKQAVGADVDTIVISNNLPYIEKLEQGSSQQAPTGMFLLTFTEDEFEHSLGKALANHV